jgi:hypothetical protein
MLSATRFSIFTATGTPYLYHFRSLHAYTSFKAARWSRSRVRCPKAEIADEAACAVSDATQPNFCLYIERGPSIRLAISVVDFDNPLLTGLGISINFLVFSLLDELVSVVV